MQRGGGGVRGGGDVGRKVTDAQAQGVRDKVLFEASLSNKADALQQRQRIIQHPIALKPSSTARGGTSAASAAVTAGGGGGGSSVGFNKRKGESAKKTESKSWLVGGGSGGGGATAASSAASSFGVTVNTKDGTGVREMSLRRPGRSSASSPQSVQFRKQVEERNNHHSNAAARKATDDSTAVMITQQRQRRTTDFQNNYQQQRRPLTTSSMLSRLKSRSKSQSPRHHSHLIHQEGGSSSTTTSALVRSSAAAAAADESMANVKFPSLSGGGEESKKATWGMSSPPTLGGSFMSSTRQTGPSNGATASAIARRVSGAANTGRGGSGSGGSPSQARNSPGGGSSPYALRRAGSSPSAYKIATGRGSPSFAWDSNRRVRTPTQRHDRATAGGGEAEDEDGAGGDVSGGEELGEGMTASSTGVSSVQGGRCYMEDEFAIVLHMEQNLRDSNALPSPSSSPTAFMDGADSNRGSQIAVSRLPTHFFGVFDGHAGRRCSKAISQNLAANVRRDPCFHSNLRKAATRGCLKSNADFMKQATRYRMDDGSTGIVAIVRGNFLLVANVGDSRALLVSKRKPVAMSNDHKPNRPDERRRVVAAGGRVTNSFGVSRVNGVLAVSRAFGDRGITGVIAEPEIQERHLARGDDFLVLASDGLWDVISNQECAELVHRHFQRSGPQTCADMLTERALRKGSMDNITSVVIDLRPHVAKLQTPPC